MKRCPLCNHPTEKKITMDILELREKGLTVREIAKVVGKASTTVFYHLQKENHNAE